jgi:pyruvate/2-oxoglutarate/acetoin dehydrogenase E1 component
VPEGPYEVPIGVADVKREGTDVTVVAIGALVGKALAVAEELAAEGIEVEVVDPRTLVPLDEHAILESVRKTGRVVACDSAKLTCSAASEITAIVSEKAFGSLKAAPVRVAWENVPVPFSPVLEDRVLVAERDIRNAVMATMREPVGA